MNKLKKNKNLVKQIKRDKQSFGKIYDKHYDHVKNFIKKRVKTEEIAEDLASETFSKAYRAIDDFKWQGVSIKSWVFRIARNLLIDYYRKNKKYASSSSLEGIENIVKDPYASVFSNYIKGEEELDLYNALGEFSEADQYLIYYKFFEGLQNKEIARITNMSASNVGTRLYRIRKKLKSILNKKGIFKDENS